MKISLGSSNKNDFVLNQPGVEAIHAEIEVIDSNTILITNKSNTSKILIDGRPIVKARLKRKNALVIGEYEPVTDEFINTANKIYKQNKIDYTQEFSILMKDFYLYQKKKDEINKNPITPLIIRSVATIGIMWVLYNFIEINNSPKNDPKWTILIVSGSGAISMILGSFFTPSNTTRNEKLDKLLLKYEAILVCPKCGIKMINNSYTYWIGKKKCINEKCNAIFQY